MQNSGPLVVASIFSRFHFTLHFANQKTGTAQFLLRMKYGPILPHCECMHLLSSSICFYSSPNLCGRRLDVYYTLTHGVALVRI